MKINKRELITSGLGVFVCNLPSIAMAKQNLPKQNLYGEVFDIVWKNIADKYCFFAEKSIDWEFARRIYRPQAISARSQIAFKAVIASLLRETYDPHTNVHDMPEGYKRFPYFDLYCQKIDNDYVVNAIKQKSSAAINGVMPMDKIIKIDNLPIQEMVKKNLPLSLIKPDPAAEEMALNQALAGKIAIPRQLVIRRDNQEKTIDLPLAVNFNDLPDIKYKMLEGNIGYIEIHSFADEKIVTEFAKAMQEFKDTKAIIIDVRYNGGGDTAYARPIMGWFTADKKPYALMNERNGKGMGEKWTEYVEPNGDYCYKKPVVILCNHWSASMAEGFPMGMRAVCGAKIIGTKMMGLGAAVESNNIEDVNLSYQYSFQPVYDVNGVSRSLFSPDITIRNDEDFIGAALKYLS